MLETNTEFDTSVVEASPHERLVMPPKLESLWIVYWEHKDKIKSGHGEAIQKAAAIEAVNHGNLKFPEIHHWIMAA